MSDLQKRNTAAMISATERFESNVAELRLMVVAQNAKIAALSAELASIKRSLVLASVARQTDITGHGGTV